MPLIFDAVKLLGPLTPLPFDAPITSWWPLTPQQPQVAFDAPIPQGGGKSFGTKEYVKEHVEIVHEGKKPFKCEYCDVSFGRKPDLKKHVTYKHNIFEKSQEKDTVKKQNE